MFYYYDFFALLFLLIIPVVLWMIFAPIYLIYKTRRLEREIISLRQHLENNPPVPTELGNGEVFNEPLNKTKPVSMYSDSGQLIPKPRELTPIPAPEPESEFWLWLKQDFLVKIGAFLLILAFAWFVTYAFANNWIGPVGRITLGIIFGTAVLVFGTQRMMKSLSQGSIFSIVGSLIIIITISAGQFVYEMFPPQVALGLIFLVSVYVAFVSLSYERNQLAYASLISALMAPFLINSNTGDSLSLMFYLLLIIIGTLWVVWRLRAEKITLVALLGVIVYTEVAYSLDTGVALLFSFVFTGIFFVTNIISLIRRYTKWVSPVHVMTALLTGVYLISSIIGASPEEWRSTYLLFWALVFAYGSFQVFIRTLNRTPFYIYTSVSLIMMGTATVIELSGPWLTIVLTLEVLATVILLKQLTKDKRASNLSLALFVVPGLYTFGHISTYAWQSGIPNGDLLALLIFTGSIILAGLVKSGLLPETNASESLAQNDGQVLFTIAGIYIGIIIWLILHALFTNMVGTMLAMIIYSIIGLVLYIKGKFENNKTIKTIGIVILSFVVIRLILVDVWAMETAGRIITFLIIGLLFMSTAFLPRLKKNYHQPN